MKIKQLIVKRWIIIIIRIYGDTQCGFLSIADNDTPSQQLQLQHIEMMPGSIHTCGWRINTIVVSNVDET